MQVTNERRLARIAIDIAENCGDTANFYMNKFMSAHADIDTFRDNEAYINARKAAHYAFIVLGRPDAKTS